MTRLPASEFGLHLRLWSRLRPFWPYLGALFLLSLLAAPLALMTPLPVKIVIDSVLGSQPLPRFLEVLLPDPSETRSGQPEAAPLILEKEAAQHDESVARSGTSVLLLAVGLLLASAVLNQLQELASALLRAYTGQKLLVEFRSELFRCVQRLSFACTDSRGTADFNYRIQHDAAAIESIAVDGFIPLVSATITIASMVYVAALLDWELALVALAITPLLFLVISIYRRRLRSGSREVHRLESAALSVIHEVLAAIRVVKAFGQEDREETRFARRSAEGLRARLRLVISEGAFGLLVGLVTAAGTSAILLVGVRHVQSGILTLGELLLILGYLAQLYSPLKTISKKAARMQSYLASAERAFSLLDEAPDVQDRPQARSLDRARGAMAFHKVRFAYDSGQVVLQDFSFEAAPGTCVGIVGATGAGKTTLVSLLPRFYDPTAGEILLDGVDLRDYKLADLRRQFAIVLQEPILFSTSIAENIAYARPEASEEEIIAAAAAAGAHDFITRLPKGYETLAGERGMLLSGGERQRIALARAFLRDAPILILDEPTSSVDAKTEAAILETLEDLMRGRTAFLISHRPSALRVCDCVLGIEKGQVVEQASSMGATR